MKIAFIATYRNKWDVAELTQEEARAVTATWARIRRRVDELEAEGLDTSEAQRRAYDEVVK